MLDFFRKLIDTTGFPARWYCGTTWQQEPAWGWIHIISDLFIWSAYMAIPMLIMFYLRNRPDIRLRGVLWLCVAFIFFCGLTHLLDSILFWWPIYRVAGLTKLITAVVSWATVVAMIPIVPLLIRLKAPEQLEEMVKIRTIELEALTQKLKSEAERNQLLARKLEEEHNRLNLALQVGQMGTWDWDFTTDLIIMDDAELKLVDMQSNQNLVTLQQFMKKVHPDDLQQLNQSIKYAFTPGNDYQGEFRIIADDGSIRWLAGRGMVEFDDQQRPLNMRGVNFDITNSKQTMDQVKASEAFLKTILNSSPDCIFVTDMNGNLLAANNPAINMLGFSLYEEIDGKNWLDFWSVETRDDLAITHRGAIKEGLSHTTALRKSPLNELTYWDIIISYIPGKDGESGRMLCTARDTTMLSKLQLDKQEIDHRFATLADNIAQFAWMADKNGYIFWYNKRWYDYTGTTLEEMQGWGWQKVHHPDHVERVVKKVKHCFDTGTFWEDTFPLRGTDGNYRWFLSRAVPIYNEQNEVYIWLGTNTDITENREIEEQLKIRTRAIEATTNGIIITDARQHDNPIVYVNPSFEQLTGFSYEESVGKNCRFLQTAETDPHHSEIIRNAIINHQECHVTILNQKKSGKLFWNDLHISPVEDDHGQVTHFVGIQSDITDRIDYEYELELAQEKADSANKAKSEFLANMSHEIRTPLTAILGCADMLYKQIDEAEPKDVVRMIRDQGNLLLGILNDVLDLSKIEAGKLEIHVESCEIHKIVENVFSLMNSQAIEKGLSLEVIYETPLPRRIKTDPLRVRQILLNLVSNALKFTHEGEVKILVSMDEVQSGNYELVLKVTDTGIGIPEDKLDQIFEAFTQGENANSPLIIGTGLGLTICQKLAGMLHGRISVSSKLHSGSMFSVHVPVGQLEAESFKNISQIKSASEKESSEFSIIPRMSLRILIAEDTRGIQFMMKRLLQDVAKEIVIVNNGEEAVEALEHSIVQNNPFNVILMDMQMPVLNGFQATKKIRELGYKIPVIALTAGAMAGDREKCLSVGCTDYLTKPVDRNELINMLQLIYKSNL